MKKKILSLLLVAVMLFSCAIVNAEETAIHPEEQMVIDYTNNFKKTVIRAYAHDIADNYYYGISDEELLYAVICSAVDEGKVDLNKAIEAMINTLDDKYAEFYTIEEYMELTQNISGEFSGIGVIITQNETGALVTSVIKDGPAEKAGIQMGDSIIRVNGANVTGMSVEAIKNLIVGETESNVTITVLRSGEELEFDCVRGTVSMPNIETEMLNDDTAYLGIVQFLQNTPEEIQEYVDSLRKDKIGKLVIDLRNNPGGDLEAAIAIANIFISTGNIAQLKYRNSSLDTIIKSQNFHAPRFKIAVLVNENSASASEFLAMAFQSRNAAEIIGVKTYGKGSMQSVQRLPNGSGIKYTVGEFYSPKGERVNTIGITPDIIVENETVAVDEESFTEIDFSRIDEAGKDGEMNLALEQRLHAVGILMEEPDEVFDEATKTAVKELQIAIGYDVTGIPGFNEYLYMNDFDYEFEKVIDCQLDAAIDYLSKKR